MVTSENGGSGGQSRVIKLERGWKWERRKRFELFAKTNYYIQLGFLGGGFGFSVKLGCLLQESCTTHGRVVQLKTRFL